MKPVYYYLSVRSPHQLLQVRLYETGILPCR